MLFIGENLAIFGTVNTLYYFQYKPS